MANAQLDSIFMKNGDTLAGYVFLNPKFKSVVYFKEETESEWSSRISLSQALKVIFANGNIHYIDSVEKEYDDLELNFKRNLKSQGKVIEKDLPFYAIYSGIDMTFDPDFVELNLFNLGFFINKKLNGLNHISYGGHFRIDGYFGGSFSYNVRRRGRFLENGITAGYHNDWFNSRGTEYIQLGYEFGVRRANLGGGFFSRFIISPGLVLLPGGIRLYNFSIKGDFGVGFKK